MTEVVSAEDFDDAVQRAIDALHNGDLVVLPTETVYAVVADAFQRGATQRLLGAKGRGRQVPLSLLIRNPRQVIGLASDVPDTAERLMASYWPGPVALVLPAQPDMPWELGKTDGAITLRMPADDLILAVAAEVGPLACSAANRRDQPAPTTVAAAQEQMDDAVDLFIDAGESAGGLTTVVDCTRDGIHVLREGLIPAADITRVAYGDVGWGQQPEHRPPVEEADEVAPAAMAVDPHAPVDDGDDAGGSGGSQPPG